MDISTSGAYAKPVWLNILVDKGHEIFCGFDNEKTGDIIANKMIRFFPTVKRLRPTKHDWNGILVSKYKKYALLLCEVALLRSTRIVDFSISFN